jgi:WD40 repeat protein
LESGRGAVGILEVSRDGKMCVAGHADFWISLWDLPSKKLTLKWKSHLEPLNAVACSPDGRLVATAAASNDPQENLKIWESANSNLVATLRGHSTHVRALRFSPQGELLATLGTDGRVLVWNLKSGSVIANRGNRGSTAIAVDWTRDGKSLFTLYADGMLWRSDNTPTETRLVIGGLRAESDLVKFFSNRSK